MVQKSHRTYAQRGSIIKKERCVWDLRGHLQAAEGAKVNLITSWYFCLLKL